MFLEKVSERDLFINEIKKAAKEKGVSLKDLFGTIRYLLSGVFQGIGVHDLLEMLNVEEIKTRLSVLIK